MAKDVKKITACRACKTRAFVPVLDFGKSPPANEFLKNLSKKSVKDELWFPLKVLFCKKCSLLQLSDVVDPKLLFSNYVYVSSTSQTFVNHFKQMAKSVSKTLRLEKNNLVIDIGSNDGILLKPFKGKGMKVLGVEPAKNIAAVARKGGVETVGEFFSVQVAQKILKKNGKASLMTATNVFAHVDDLDELVSGVKVLLDDEGVFMIEVPYLVDFVNKNLFDTVYHEHLSYFSVSSLKVLFERLGMKIIRVEKVRSHGGSIRVFTKKAVGARPVESSVGQYCYREKQMGLNRLGVYKAMSKRVEKNKNELVKKLKLLKKQGKSVAGFGAPAKGNTMLNYFNIDTKLIDFIVDDSPLKQGLYTPGTHIKVVESDVMYDKMPDYVLILAWNFAKPIMKAHKKYKIGGGKFIVPVPKLKMV